MERSTKILLVDCEKTSIYQLAPFLKRAGYVVTVANNGHDALQYITEISPDCIVTEVQLSDFSGRELLRYLRQSGNWTPLILLSQLSNSLERAIVLEEGADDYVLKDWSSNEILARIKAVVRRTKDSHSLPRGNRFLCNGNLCLDLIARRVWNGSNEVILTSKAMAMLEYFLRHPEELITRENLMNTVWGFDYPVTSRALDTRIAELRRALGCDAKKPRYIETVMNQGYRFIGV